MLLSQAGFGQIIYHSNRIKQKKSKQATLLRKPLKLDCPHQATSLTNACQRRSVTHLSQHSRLAFACVAGFLDKVLILQLQSGIALQRTEAVQCVG